ncbi:MAG: Maf family protein [Steroidobacteraceae bacterium]
MSAADPVLCLASASPRRRDLLHQIGVPHLVVPAAIDETQRDGELPPDYALRMAREKALHVARLDAARGLAVLGADTVVVARGRVLGKPRDRNDAAAMLELLSGAAHAVTSAVALVTGDRVDARLSESEVRFRATTAAERAAYCATREPLDKAGGYAVQGFAAVFVAAIRGSYSGVMGLPLFETAQLLRAAGIPYWVGSHA